MHKPTPADITLPVHGLRHATNNYFVKQLLLITILLALCAGCERDALDVDLLDDIELTPTVEVPLVTGYLDFTKVVRNDSTAVVDPDLFTRVVVRRDNMLQLSLLDFLHIDPFSLSVQEVPARDGTARDTLAFAVDQGVELATLTCLSGRLLVDGTTSGLSRDATFTVSLPGSTAANGSELRGTVTVARGETSGQLSLNLAGATLDLTSNRSQTFNQLRVEVQLASHQQFSQADRFAADLHFGDVVPQRVKGKFEDLAVRMTPDTVASDIIGLSDVLRGLEIRDPKLTIFSRSTLDSRLILAPNVQATTVDLERLRLRGPELHTQRGQIDAPVIDSVVYTRDNSDLPQFLSHVPPRIDVGGLAQVVANPDSELLSVLHRESSIQLGVELELPLEFKLDNAEIIDTIEFRLDDSNLDEVKDLTFLIKSENTFPFELRLTVDFLDENYRIIPALALDLDVLEAAPVGSDGRTTGPTYSSDELPFTQTMVELLPEVHYLRLRARASGSNRDEFVRIYEDYALAAAIAARATLAIKLAN